MWLGGGVWGLPVFREWRSRWTKIDSFYSSLKRGVKEAISHRFEREVKEAIYNNRDTIYLLRWALCVIMLHQLQLISLKQRCFITCTARVDSKGTRCFESGVNEAAEGWNIVKCGQQQHLLLPDSLCALNCLFSSEKENILSVLSVTRLINLHSKNTE